MHRIAFTSCARIRYNNSKHDGALPYQMNPKDFDQPVWEYLLSHHKEKAFDAVLFLGDQVYTDYNFGNAPQNWDPDVFHRLLYAMYAAQYDQVGAFKTLIKQLFMDHTKIGMIWDDHDFGYNNGGGRDLVFQNKMGSTRKLFEQFRDMVSRPLTDYPAIPIRPTTHPNEGIERIKDPIKLGDSIEIVMLDGRWYREDTKEANAQLLGESQWRDLEEKMSAWPENKLLIVCLGTVYAHKGLGADQSWYRGGKSYAHFQRFTELAKQKHIVFLTGDIHTNNFSSYTGFCEVTSSGAHTPKELFFNLLEPKNRHRFGILDIYDDRVVVNLFADNKIEADKSKTISRVTGLPIT